MPAKKPALRAVNPTDPLPTPSRKPSVAEAAASGDQRALLEAMRDRIAVTVTNPDCPPRDLAALTKRLADIAEQLKALDLQHAEEEGHHGPTPDEAWSEEAL